jgi:ATP-binding cassette subfamily F protein 3
MIITHDREFMDNVTTHTMIIRRKQVRRIEGSSKKLLDQLSVDDEIYEKSRVNEDKKRKEVEEFINRFRAKASKASQVQSRVKALEKMGQKEELVDEVKLDFQFSQAPFAGKYILEVDNLEFGYKPEQTLIRRLGFTLAKGERIGVVGKNGRGKSTLLKLLAGELAPREGTVKLSPNAQLGYFGQTNISRLNEAKTIEQEVQEANSNLHRTKVRAICGTMMFPGDAAEKKISVLSGGERSRVLIGKILASPSNILLLDEPTNHLDIESIEALIESLKTYEGGIVIVTHNEHILRDLATKLIVFDGNTAQVIPGDYDYFLSTVGWGDDDASQMSSRKKEKDNKSKGAAPAGNVNATKLKSNAKEIANIEKEIGVLEKRLEVANEKMVQASQNQDRVGISSSGKEIAELENQITKAYEKFQQLLE